MNPEATGEFWTPFIAFLTVLGVCLLFLGIILGVWASASRTEDRKDSQL